MEKIRVLLANEPRTYREAISEALQEFRPHVEVSASEPGDLDSEVVRRDPHLVVHSRDLVADEAPSYPPAWVMLYPDGEDRADVRILEERTTVPNVRFSDLLSILDRMEFLCRSA